jgi:hypothetical protein
VETLAHYPLIIRDGRPDSRTDKLLSGIRAMGVDVVVDMRCDSSDAVKTIVEQGEAIGILYWENIKRGIKTGQFRTINVTGVNLTVSRCRALWNRRSWLSRFDLAKIVQG